MNTRSLPRMSGQSALDIDARRIRERAARVAARRGNTTAPAATSRWQVTWFADMLTPDKNSFGVLRLAMAFLVLVSHAVFLTTGKVTMEPLYSWTGYTLGQHGVQVFFILSGILVTQSLFQSRSVTDYALARGLRIFPALAVCVLLTAMVLGPLLSDLPAAMYLRDKWTASYIVKTLSLWTGSAELPGLFQNNTVPRTVNTSVWTLKYEVLCYGILAVIGVVLLRVKAWRQATLIVAFTWLMFALTVPASISASAGERSMLQVLHYFIIFFGTGVLAYAARQWIPVHAGILLPLGALFWLAIGTRFAVPAMAVFLGYASIWLATFRFGPLRNLTNNNDYSYATYLYHYPVAQAVLHVAPDIHVVPLIGITTGIVMPLAFLSWELIERPALALRKRFHRSVPVQTIKAGEVPVATVPIERPRPTKPVQQTDRDASVARVWRPMPTRRPISVMPDLPHAPLDAIVTATDPILPTPEHATMSAAQPHSAAVAPRAPAPKPNPQQRTFSARRPVPPVDSAPEPPRAAIPQSRMALATKRQAPPTPRSPADAKVPNEPGRAVVAVGDDVTHARRVAPPRPNWQHPSPPPA